MEFSMKKLVLLILALTLFSFNITVEAKDGKVKYGKYIFYEGEIEDDVPNGP